MNPRTALTDRRREAFLRSFPDMPAGDGPEDREARARMAYVAGRPLLEAVTALNDFKRRYAAALKTGKTSHLLAAVHAYQRDALAMVSQGSLGPASLRHRESMLSKAADLAAEPGWREEGGHVLSVSQARDFETWLDEQVEELDALEAVDVMEGGAIRP